MIGLVFLLLFMPTFSVAAERPTDFAYGMAIAADGAQALHEIEIPAAVYRAVTRADLGAVRVLNGQGEVGLALPDAELQPVAGGLAEEVVHGGAARGGNRPLLEIEAPPV